MFESEYTTCKYIKEDNVLFHIWKKEAHYENYRKPVEASLEMLRKYKNSIFIVDARHGFEDVEWGFILPTGSDIEGEIDLWTKEIDKNFMKILSFR